MDEHLVVITSIQIVISDNYFKKYIGINIKLRCISSETLAETEMVMKIQFICSNFLFQEADELNNLFFLIIPTGEFYQLYHLHQNIHKLYAYLFYRLILDILDTLAQHVNV